MARPQSKTCGGIWKDGLTAADCPDKSESIQTKKTWFQDV
jgi:hypothetical protein